MTCPILRYKRSQRQMATSPATDLLGPKTTCSGGDHSGNNSKLLEPELTAIRADSSMLRITSSGEIARRSLRATTGEMALSNDSTTISGDQLLDTRSYLPVQGPMEMEMASSTPLIT